jgi:hypothetical protein
MLTEEPAAGLWCDVPAKVIMRPLAASQSSDVNIVDGHVSTQYDEGSAGSAPCVVNSVG